MQLSKRIKTLIVMSLISVSIISVIFWKASYSDHRSHELKQCDPEFTWDDMTATGLAWDGYDSLYMTDGSLLLRYDLESRNFTDIFDVPQEVTYGVNDICVPRYQRVYLLTDDSAYPFKIFKNGHFYNLSVQGLNSAMTLEVAAKDATRGVVYLGGIDTGLMIYDIGFLSNITDLPDYQIECIEYYPGTDDVYIGTNSGLHICRQEGPTWNYFRTIGPSDGLPSSSIEDIRLDVTSHKMIVCTPKGLCTIDLYDYSVSLLEDTLDSERSAETQFRPTSIYHEYHGAHCYLYFTTFSKGLWNIVIDYSATEPPDYSSAFFQIGLTLLAVFGGGLVSAINNIYYQKSLEQTEEASK
jgi:hypothetical protein